MMIYALTGGIGSGKSTVAKMLEERGIPTISSDLLNSEAAKLPEIQKRIIDRFGTMNRLELRKIIFADKQAKKDMEEIMHPEVQNLFFKKLEDLSSKGHEIVIYESAIVFEMHQEGMFAGVILVDCPEEIRLKRVLERENMNEEIAKNIISCQVTDEYRWDHSDFVIYNWRGIEFLEERVKRLIRQIRQGDPLPLSKDTKD